MKNQEKDCECDRTAASGHQPHCEFSPGDTPLPVIEGWINEKIERLSVLIDLQSLFRVLLAQERQRLGEKLAGMKKEQLDKDDPDNYGACYAIPGFNDALDALDKALKVIQIKKAHGDEPLNEWIYEVEDRLCYRTGEGDDATKCLLHEDFKEIAERHQKRVKEFKSETSKSNE